MRGGEDYVGIYAPRKMRDGGKFGEVRMATACGRDTTEISLAAMLIASFVTHLSGRGLVLKYNLVIEDHYLKVRGSNERSLPHATSRVLWYPTGIATGTLLVLGSTGAHLPL